MTIRDGMSARYGSGNPRPPNEAGPPPAPKDSLMIDRVSIQNLLIRMIPRVGSILLAPVEHPDIIDGKEPFSIPDWLSVFEPELRIQVCYYEIGAFDGSDPTKRSVLLIDSLAEYFEDSNITQMESVANDWFYIRSSISQLGIDTPGVEVSHDAEAQYKVAFQRPD
jgi:hypothetical protein